jgi:iron complex transport system ATP-binding protein
VDSRLSTRALTLGYEGRVVVSSLDLVVPTSKITVLVGSNGSGKSTLLRGMARLLKPQSGSVVLDGAEIQSLSTRVVAKRLGLLPQGPVAPEGLSVRDLVAQGRYPHQGWLRQWSDEDEAMTIKALEATNTLQFADKAVDALSGGERQRAWIAMVLAQGTEILLLDEPTTYLDMAHQLEVLDLLEELNAEDGRTIVMVLHDINQACRYAQYLVAIKHGAVSVAGDPAQVVTEAMIRDVFGVDCHIGVDPVAGTPLCVPLGRRPRPVAGQRQVQTVRV